MAGNKGMGGEFKFTAQEERPVFVTVQDPVTGDDILLLDPAYHQYQHDVTVIRVADAQSFARAVAAVRGPNTLVTFAESRFGYANARGRSSTAEVVFPLLPAPTAPMLCLDGAKSFTQAKLLQWIEQWPGVLTPECEDPAEEKAIVEALRAFQAEKTTKYSAIKGDRSISISCEGAVLGLEEVPLYWKARTGPQAG